ncbi:DUF4164 family protein [Methylobacterium sp. ID0610]|uniref:DUF4164 family protein n=1 Tax=Methylobacterium carpenticola TaxID=3344827 RepID=UPI003689FC6F
MSAAVEDALRRLEAAVALLDAAVTRKLDAERSRGDLEAELALMQEDRARLAAELDGALAQLAEAVAVTDDVENRLGRAIGTVEGVITRGRADG